MLEIHVDTTATNQTGDASMSILSHRWVTESANPSRWFCPFGRHAQRKVIVQGLQAEMNATQEVRDDESRIFNLLATPGYPRTNRRNDSTKRRQRLVSIYSW